MSGPLLFALVLAAHPVVRSDSHCPSATDIEANLSILLPETVRQPGTASVSTTPEGLVLDLLPQSVEYRARRPLAEVGTCEERAKAAAVIIATWWPLGLTPSRSRGTW
jgi:hypothetical protein